MPSEQRDFLVRHLESSRDALAAELADVDLEAWTMPGGDAWTMAGCAEHILIVERRVAGLVRRIPDMPAEDYDLDESHRKDELVLGVAHRGAVRVEAPEHLHPAGAYTTPVALLHDFNKERSQVLAIAAEFPEWLRGRFVEHPILKKLDGYQWLLATSCHTLRHVAQMVELKQRMPLPN